MSYTFFFQAVGTYIILAAPWHIVVCGVRKLAHTNRYTAGPIPLILRHAVTKLWCVVSGSWHTLIGTKRVPVELDAVLRAACLQNLSLGRRTF